MNNYTHKFALIRKFVNLKIPHNKINFSSAEKSAITRYYNKLDHLGYFQGEREGYVLHDITNKDIKLKNAPKIKKIFVNVGTVQDDKGNISTAHARITIKNGKIYTKRRDGATRWQFFYNINRDWNKPDFEKHLLKQMGKKPTEGEYYQVGAGIYVIGGTVSDRLGDIAGEILKLHAKYSKIYEDAKEKADSGEEMTRYEREVYKKKTSDWLNNVVVYNAASAVAEYIRKKKRTKKKGHTHHDKKGRNR